MSDIQLMNTEMLEILKNYIEIYSFFNEKLEEIKADEVLNINLELLKASITDLNINIDNFKSDIQSKINNAEDTNSENNTETESNANKNTLDNYTEIDKQNLIALFFMYLMHIDKDSILNKPAPSKSSIPNLTSQSNASSTFNAIPITDCKKKYEYDDPDLD